MGIAIAPANITGVLNVSKEVAAAGKRHGVHFYNSASDAWLAIGHPAEIGKGIFLGAGEPLFLHNLNAGHSINHQINAISAAALDIAVQEL